MSLLSKTRLRLRAMLRPEDVEADIEDELRFHLDMRAEEYRQRGLERRDAERAAERRFGNLKGVRAECRRLSMLQPFRGGDGFMGSWLHDFRLAVRSLSRTPGFTIVVSLTLALGIGANVAIFSVVEGVLLRPFSYDEPERLVMVWQNDRLRGTTKEWFSGPDFADVRAQNEVFEELAFFYTSPVTWTDASNEPMRVNATSTSASLFRVLRKAPALGRVFRAEEDTPGGNRVVLLSHDLWRRRFRGADSVVGSTIFLDGESTEIVGVMGPQFHFPADADLWVPAQIVPSDTPRGNHGFTVVARLAPGTSLGRANASMKIIAAALEARYKDNNQGRGMWAESLSEASVGGVRTALLTLLGAVLFVLLIACVNVANLLFARSLVRQRELAIRTAMGAGRGALLRQSMSESLALSAGGSLLGLLFAHRGLDALVSLAPSDLPRAANVAVNGTVLGFAVFVSLLVAAVFGLIPALQLSQRSLVSSLRDGARSGASGAKRRMREVLVVAEVALAVVLVVGAGLLMASFWNLRRIDPGFTPADVVSVNLALPASRYEQNGETWPRWAAVRQFQDELLARVAASPGAESAALAINGPLDAGWTSRFTIEGRAAIAPGEQDEVRVRVISPGYLRTVGIPLLRGRALETRDNRTDAPPVILVNEAFAKRYFVDEDPLGSRVTQWGLTREIVGIVQNVKFRGLDAEAAPAIYPTFSQAPFSGFSLLVRTGETPEKSFAEIREIVRRMDPNLALSSFATLEERLSASVAAPRFTTALFGSFATMALLLAALGIYGVMSENVRQRHHEIGIRMSLGAARRDVLRLVISQGACLAVRGIALGVAAAALLTGALQGLLFGVGRLDSHTAGTLSTFGAVVVLAALVMLAASYIPATRATRVDPIATLRHD